MPSKRSFTLAVIILRSEKRLFTALGIWSSVAYVLKNKTCVLACKSSMARICSTDLQKTALAQSEYNTRVFGITCAVARRWSSLAMSVLKSSLVDSLAEMVVYPLWSRKSHRTLAIMASPALYSMKRTSRPSETFKPFPWYTHIYTNKMMN